MPEIINQKVNSNITQKKEVINGNINKNTQNPYVTFQNEFQLPNTNSFKNNSDQPTTLYCCFYRIELA